MKTTLPPYPKKSGFYIAAAIVRYVLGIPLVVFGLNMFLNFIPEPKIELPVGATAFSTALISSGYMMPMIGVTFLLVGLFLVFNRFVPLALALFAPFMVNSILFHVFLEHTGLPMSLVFLALELFLAWSYRSAFRSMLAARVMPG
ncbi:MAG: DoxX family protein [Opitutaceae bacterium]